MKKLATLFLPFLLVLTAACGKEEHRFEAPLAVETSLAEHSNEFKREVIEVTDGVHVAVGFGLANSILLEGDDGVVIVDTMESVDEANAVLAEFRKITDKPVRAIIFTHNHADHILGSKAFADPEDVAAGRVDVYAHDSTTHYIDRIFTVVRPIITVRSMRMFGNYLDEEGLVNAGIGPFLGVNDESTLGLLRPTKTFRDDLSIEVAGLRLELSHAPGETNDQLFVWLPDKKVLLPGDNLYRTFPNLYTIRGTPYRDVVSWFESLDRMRDLQPEFLVPSHTRPISGAENVEATLRDYRDAIQFVHDQTIRWMNKGLTPGEIAEKVQLPPHLTASPFLREFYGKVEWSVRSVFTGYLGWFDGDPATLHPLAPQDKAERMARLAGGYDALFKEAEEAAAADDPRWALELTSYLRRLNDTDAAVNRLRFDLLKALGEAETNPNARHYYLTTALELRDGFSILDDLPVHEEMVHEVPLKAIFQGLAVRLDPEKSADVDQKVAFLFPDAGEAYTVHVRRGVAEVRDRDTGAEMRVTVDANVWKEVAAGLRSPAVAFAKGEIKVDGGTLDLVGFLGLFERDQ